MKFLPDMQKCTTIKTLSPQFSFSIKRKLMDLEAAGFSRNVSNIINRFSSKEYLTAQSGNGIDEGTWDAIHVVTTTIDGNQATYTSVSAVFAMMNCSKTNTVGKMDLGGHLNMRKE
jgi:hypothetical protein